MMQLLLLFVIQVLHHGTAFNLIKRQGLDRDVGNGPPFNCPPPTTLCQPCRPCGSSTCPKPPACVDCTEEINRLNSEISSLQTQLDSASSALNDARKLIDDYQYCSAIDNIPKCLADSRCKVGAVCIPA